MMNNKAMMRKKAMDMLASEGPSVAKKMASRGQGMGEMSEGSDEMEQKPEPGEGFEQFMVTPEEKEMILSMRKKKSQPEMEMAEGEEDEMA